MSPPEDATRDAYDAVAQEYEKQLADELDGKPLDRALLAAFAELVGPGIVADVGCGPGHVAAQLRALGSELIGVDLSPSMIEIARARYPAIDFQVGSMLDLPAADGAWAGAVLMYSIIHLPPAQRGPAYRELARVVRFGGLALLAFHVSDASHAPGDVSTMEEFMGQPVELTHYYLGPDDVAAGLTSAGFVEVARLEREPHPGAEYPSRRCYLLARRGGH
ncbi:MAG TPA: methyltransferase domain-containing protein [Jatrophihabitantaceae bacterium]